MALTTVADIKTANFITGTAEDAWITLVQPSVEAVLQKWIGYNLAATTYTEFYNGNNTTEILLRNLPVNSVANVWVDSLGQDGQNANPTPFATPLDAYTYWLQLDGPGGAYSATGTLVRSNDIWPGIRVRPYNRLSYKEAPGLGNIKITYNAGYAVIPDDIKLAVWESMGQLRNMRRFGFLGPIKSESLTQSAYSLGDLYKMIYMLGSVQQVLSLYRRLPI